MAPLQSSAGIKGLIIANLASIGFLFVKELVRSSFWNARTRKEAALKEKQEEKERLDGIAKQVAELAKSVCDISGTVAAVRAQTDTLQQAVMKAITFKTDP